MEETEVSHAEKFFEIKIFCSVLFSSGSFMLDWGYFYCSECQSYRPGAASGMCGGSQWGGRQNCGRGEYKLGEQFMLLKLGNWGVYFCRGYLSRS